MKMSSTTAAPSTAVSTKPPLPSPLVRLDQSISHTLHTIAKPFLPTFLLLLLELSADFRLSFPVSLALLLTPTASASASDTVRRQFLYPFLAGLLLDLALVGLVKILVRRSRPHYNHHSMHAAVHADHYSFPSGHASRVCFVAAAVNIGAKQLTLSEAVFIIHPRVAEIVEVTVCSWAAVTALSRVLLGRHFVFDVIAGACLGVVEAVIVFRFLRF